MRATGWTNTQPTHGLEGPEDAADCFWLCWGEIPARAIPASRHATRNRVLDEFICIFFRRLLYPGYLQLTS